MDLERRKQLIIDEMTTARERTLSLFRCVPEEYYNVRVHDFYSPIGWHFGHIGMTEEFWVAHEALALPVCDDRLSFLFANLPDNPKHNRIHLPSREEVIAYLEATRDRSLSLLQQANISTNPASTAAVSRERKELLLAEGYAWRFAVQHELQHQETIAELLQLITMHKYKATRASNASGCPAADRHNPFPSRMISIPAGEFVMGSDCMHGYDNEKPAHHVEIEAFELDETPVTAAQWVGFMSDGGYVRPDFWSISGWNWRCSHNIVRPEYWYEADCSLGYRSYGAFFSREIHPEEPVTSLSWFEADAYARWKGMRLPTEEEWEYAAAYNSLTKSSYTYPWGDEEPTEEHAQFGLNSFAPAQVGSRPNGASPFGLLDMAGNAWEWTSTPFGPYTGFEPFPYEGYSLDHMDGSHFVCRGGSWATASNILRCSFRNWYPPSYRQGFLGMRCAR